MMKKQTINGYTKTQRGNWYFTTTKGYGLGLKRDFNQFTLDVFAMTLIICNFIYYGNL